MDVLHIDDDEDDLEIFENAVRTLNVQCNCLKALGGHEAIRILKSMIPDYIFLDVNMPAMNGRQVLKAIRSQDQLLNVPVIMFSTSIHPIEAIEFKNAGATHCLVKPSDFERLRELLKDFFQANKLPQPD